MALLRRGSCGSIPCSGSYRRIDESPYSRSLKLAAQKLTTIDEKNLPASQSETNPQARLSGADGVAGRTQGAQAPARQGAQAPGRNDSAQAARLTEPSTRCFGAADRLKASADFVRIQRNGARWQSEHFVLYGLTAPEFGRAKLGIAVSRRIGNAVVRNRLKRRLRECFRLELRPIMLPETALVVIARAGAGGLATPTIKAELAAATLSLSRKLKGPRSA